jgi:hypothetical protein
MINLRSIFIMIFTVFVLPLTAFAHGTEVVHQKEEITNTLLKNGMIVSAVILILGILLWFQSKKQLSRVNVKNKVGRKKKDYLDKKLKWNLALVILGALLLIGTGIGFTLTKPQNQEAVDFIHIHGLGYTNDGKQIFVPAHDGLKVFDGHTWKDYNKIEKNDFMGFSAVKNGFYSSGHPSPDSKLANPLGIVKNTNYGPELKILDLYKEMDFHAMTAGYETNEIYVFNTMKNSKMSDTGLYYTTDETKSWHKSELNGLSGQATSIAAHATEKGVVAIGTDNGVYLSKDYGNNFELILPDINVTTISFDHNNGLIIGYITDKSKLLSFNLTNKETKDLNVPDLGNTAIAYVQQNPANVSGFTFATIDKDIYISKNAGSNWTEMVDKGVVKENAK